MTTALPRCGTGLPDRIDPAAWQTMATILALPRTGAADADALAVPTGQGEQWRLTDGIRRWRQGRHRMLLIADGNPAERTCPTLSADYLRDLGLDGTDGVVVQPEPAPHTGAQAEWFARQVIAHRITGLAIVVTAYHLPRVFLTVLGALNRHGARIPLFPAPVPIGDHRTSPETGRRCVDLLPGEAARIDRYATEGKIAGPGELRDYLDWWWRRGPEVTGGLPVRRKPLPLLRMGWFSGGGIADWRRCWTMAEWLTPPTPVPPR